MGMMELDEQIIGLNRSSRSAKLVLPVDECYTGYERGKIMDIEIELRVPELQNGGFAPTLASLRFGLFFCLPRLLSGGIFTPPAQARAGTHQERNSFGWHLLEITTTLDCWLEGAL